MFDMKTISAVALNRFKTKHKDKDMSLMSIDNDISMYLYGVFDGKVMVGICEFINVGIDAKIIHINLLYMTSGYDNSSNFETIIQDIMKEYSDHSITYHPKGRQERDIFIGCGFVYDTTYYRHESNTVKHLSWYTNIKTEKMYIS